MQSNLSPEPSLSPHCNSSPSLPPSLSLNAEIPIYLTSVTSKCKHFLLPHFLTSVISLCAMILLFSLASSIVDDENEQLRVALLCLNLLILGGCNLFNEVIIARHEMVVMGCFRSCCFREDPISLRCFLLITRIQKITALILYTLVIIFSLSKSL